MYIHGAQCARAECAKTSAGIYAVAPLTYRKCAMSARLVTARSRIRRDMASDSVQVNTASKYIPQISDRHKLQLSIGTYQNMEGPRRVHVTFITILNASIDRPFLVNHSKKTNRRCNQFITYDYSLNNSF